METPRKLLRNYLANSLNVPLSKSVSMDQIIIDDIKNNSSTMVRTDEEETYSGG